MDRPPDPVDALFVYGTLRPRDPDDARRTGAEADAVRGRLYDLGPYPALVDLDDPDAPWVDGYVRPVTLALLDGPLDDYEGVPHGLYRRARTTTRSGRAVWVYVYGGPPPPGAAGPLTCWDGRTGAWDAFSAGDRIE